jgi:preprotein translocase subunit YajC
MSKSDMCKFKKGDRVVYIGGLHDILIGEDGVIDNVSVEHNIYIYYKVKFEISNIIYTIREAYLAEYKEDADEN